MVIFSPNKFTIIKYSKPKIWLKKGGINLALYKRFVTIDKAVLTATGNSLVTCGSTTSLGENTDSLITATGSTTRDYLNSGSSAHLNILEKSDILYAELIWYSTVRSNNNKATDVRSIADDKITFITPKGTYEIKPENTENFTSKSESIDRFRSSNVTDIIKDSLSGTYTVSKVPTSIPPSGLSNTRAGWCLSVIYRNDLLKPQKIIFLSGIAYGNNNNPLQTTVTGFTVPGQGYELKGNIFIACADGEPLTGGETLKAGPSFAALKLLGNPVEVPNKNPGTAPNNPCNSIFAGQINVCDPISENVGLIDISGTLGGMNHDAFVPLEVMGARNKWDLTNLDISNTLVPEQNILCVEITSSDPYDGIFITCGGASTSAVAPDMTVEFDAFDVDGLEAYGVETGEELVYMMKIKNNGNAEASNVIVKSTLPSSLSFIENSFKVNGLVKEDINLEEGINLGLASPSAVTNVVFMAKVNSLPEDNELEVFMDYSYEFSSGTDTIKNSGKTRKINLNVYSGSMEVKKESSVFKTSVGETFTYTTTLKNTGTLKLSNIFFQDLLGDYLSFVSNSLYINGEKQINIDPSIGFTLQDLDVNKTCEIKYDAKVLSIPPNAILNDFSYVTFSYKYDEYPFGITKTIKSNECLVSVEYSNIVGLRSNDNNYPSVDDIVTYTLAISNVGNVTAFNILVKEPYILGASFIEGSVVIDDNKKPLLNPFEGFTIFSLNPGMSTTITYKVQIKEINPNASVENIAKIPFKYQLSPEETVISTEKDSNKVLTKTNEVEVNLMEAVDKNNAALNEALYYSVNLTCSGNIPAVNTTFLSHIDESASFLPGSVKINGVAFEKYSPIKGFTLGSISPSDKINVSFMAKVINIPKPNVIYNDCELIYDYYPDPNKNPIRTTAFTNQVETTVNSFSAQIIKTADTKYTTLNEVIVYNTAITNRGTTALKDASFSDYLPAYVTFTKGTVYVNGIKYESYDPLKGFTLGDIKQGETFNITFGTRVTSLPPAGFVSNTSCITYSYRLNPDSPLIKETKDSNEAITNIVNGNLELTKAVNKAYAAVGDTLIYTFNAANKGNVTLNELFFKDIIPSGAAFIKESVSINGILKPAFNPEEGFSLGSLTSGSSISISFKAEVTGIPSPNTIINNASINYKFYISPEGEQVRASSTSNNVTTIVNKGEAVLIKNVDKKYALLKDTLNYSVTINNTGTVPLTSLFFKDIIEKNLSFVDGSVVIDGIEKKDLNPLTGFNINDINYGGSSTISFKAEIISLDPSEVVKNNSSLSFKYRIDPKGPDFSKSINSNTVTTKVISINVTNLKTVDKFYAKEGDRLTYTSVITNSSNTVIHDTLFTDFLPKEINFILGSVTIDGITKKDYDPNIGFTLEAIPINKSVTVVFNANVISLNDSGFIDNTSKLNYFYKIDPEVHSYSGSTESNVVRTFIKKGSLLVTKDADRSFARINDLINYNITIKNTGNTILKNIFFKDILQEESTFISGSVYVNGDNRQEFDPNKGFNLDDIDVGSNALVSFSVKVKAIPASGKLINTANIAYSYYVNPNEPILSANENSNTTSVNVNDTIVSANKSVDKSIAKIGDILLFSFAIKNAGNTPAQFVFFKDTLDNSLSFK